MPEACSVDAPQPGHKFRLTVETQGLPVKEWFCFARNLAIGEEQIENGRGRDT